MQTVTSAPEARLALSKFRGDHFKKLGLIGFKLKKEVQRTGVQSQRLVNILDSDGNPKVDFVFAKDTTNGDKTTVHLAFKEIFDQLSPEVKLTINI